MLVCPVCERMYPEGEHERCPYDESPLYPIGDGAHTSEDPLRPGETVAGKYLIQSELQLYSGAGRRFLAYQQQLERDVELRVLPHRSFTRPSDHARFQREVATWGRLRSDHVVRLYDSGFTHDDAPYMALEYVPAGSLGQRLADEGPRPPDEVWLAARHALAGLIAAHGAQVLHRDLSPRALVLGQHSDGDRYVRLTGFGFAKHLGDQDDDPTAITMTGQVIGNPAYMAPETILEGVLEPRTDLYALGVTIFELLTNQRPFPGRTLAELLAAHVQGRLTPLRAARPNLPERAYAFVDKLLAKTPDDRFRSAQAAFDALGTEPWVEAAPPPDAPAKRAPRPAPRTSAWAAIAWGVAVGLSAAVVLAYFIC